MNIGIILAGGKGIRMGNRTPKQFIEVNSKPIIIHTLDLFEKSPEIDALFIVCIKEWMDKVRLMLKRFDIKKVVQIVEGGEEVQQSIFNGLNAAEEYVESYKQENGDNEECIVVIHDSVRPMIDNKLLDLNIENTLKYGNSVTIAPPSETFIIEEGDSYRLYNREHVHIIRGPQCYRLNDILKLHRQAIDDKKTGFNDCCSLLCEYGIPFHETMGYSTNIKITYPSDIIMFRSLIQYREVQKMMGMD